MALDQAVWIAEKVGDGVDLFEGPFQFLAIQSRQVLGVHAVSRPDTGLNILQLLAQNSFKNKSVGRYKIVRHVSRGAQMVADLV